jgi:protein gp37
MSEHSSIEWTDATWNPVTGCTKVSPGCDHCYAETFANRFRGVPGHHFENGFDVTLRPERLDQPLKWRKPRRVFVNSMSDVFHDQVPDEYVARVFAVMAATPDHTYQVLTKRHGRMRSLLSSPDFIEVVQVAFDELAEEHDIDLIPGPWPLANVWLGVSAEDQRWADLRIPALLETPAAARFVSAEPLLGAMNLRMTETGPRPDWIIVGGESGHGARPMHPTWPQMLLDQCALAGVPFFFKQWGEWTPDLNGPGRRADVTTRLLDGYPVTTTMRRAGKKAAGRLLDGRTWEQFPAERSE